MKIKSYAKKNTYKLNLEYVFKKKEKKYDDNFSLK